MRVDGNTLNRIQIVNQIKTQCTLKYSNITDWVHDIHHIRRVVKNGKTLAKMENLTSLNSFLVEIACWLHDIGRVGETIGLEFNHSNHAEVSYQLSKQILQPFQKQLGREGTYKILQAVREHNLPRLIHPENIVGRLLVDADRGAGLNPLGIFSMLSYLQITDIEPIYNQKLARQKLPQLLEKLTKENKLKIALEKIEFLNDWYFGTEKQNRTDVLVNPLYTKSAAKLYYSGFQKILRFEGQIKALIT